MHNQEIYYGAPGTGKSRKVKDTLLAGVPQSKVFRVTIHPEFTYSDFIGQLLPEATSKGVEFKFHRGPFTDALVEAYADTSAEVFLVLEELSRGNVAAIFGDIFQLLDRDDYFVSEYPVNNKAIAVELSQATDDIKLPSNLNIIGTVNMNDQNVFPMDTAFKRRFDWKYGSTHPQVKLGTTSVDTKLNNPLIPINYSGLGGDFEVNWLSFYSALNKFITDKNEGLGKKEDKQLGQFFIKFSKDDILNSNSDTIGNPSFTPLDKTTAQDSIIETLRNKLLLYLWQDVQGVSGFTSSSSLFADNITSFDTLYEDFGNKQVFSDDFLDKFLSGTNRTIYNY
jgi:5-methylcytosine-specific restriction endonuclease McrBC GTP-binding regulatory subunit McrB